MPILFMGNVGERRGEGDLRGMRHIFADPRLKNSIVSSLVFALMEPARTPLWLKALGSRRFESDRARPGRTFLE